MTAFPIDLYSDTLTKPTPAMRRCMAEAEVGDEQKAEDPTVNQLQQMVAELTGHQAGLFLPSGTMCNLIAHTVHCRPGDEILIEKNCHPVHFEGGAAAVCARASLRLLDSERGLFTPQQVEAALRPDDPHFPKSRLVCVENTHNMGGGTVWPLAQLRAVHDTARKHGLLMHLDGARLMNAVVAGGGSARDICALFDSVWLDLTKGLGCPVGAVLAGSKDFVYQARRCKQMFGGAMRQAGIIAAAGVYALKHHVDRLAEDHANAKKLAAGLADIRGIRLDHGMPDTNIVMFDIAGIGMTRDAFFTRLGEQGVRLSGRLTPTGCRAVTHLDIPPDGVDRALTAIQRVIR